MGTAGGHRVAAPITPPKLINLRGFEMGHNMPATVMQPIPQQRAH
jgi:hypothetical protein